MSKRHTPQHRHDSSRCALDTALLKALLVSSVACARLVAPPSARLLAVAWACITLRYHQPSPPCRRALPLPCALPTLTDLQGTRDAAPHVTVDHTQPGPGSENLNGAGCLELPHARLWPHPRCARGISSSNRMPHVHSRYLATRPCTTRVPSRLLALRRHRGRFFPRYTHLAAATHALEPPPRRSAHSHCLPRRCRLYSLPLSSR